MEGLPDGIEFKDPSSYGLASLRLIISHKDAIKFVNVKPASSTSADVSDSPHLLLTSNSIDAVEEVEGSEGNRILTGHIISVLGLYHADYKNSDANIIKHNFKVNMVQMTDWITEGDILIVDRGFRDAVDFPEEMGVHSKMNYFLKKGQKQYTEEEV
ncbi:GTF2I [Mytilus edulis]|uniref:TFII-I n=1 Tax=Mytilus edulis TaxID=6550 RepID=A0A8S3R2I3_MYTED|nr:GTF2I [Mytilus edulis]